MKHTFIVDGRFYITAELEDNLWYYELKKKRFFKKDKVINFTFEPWVSKNFTNVVRRLFEEKGIPLSNNATHPFLNLF